MMRFKTDENLHPEVCEPLRAAGYDAVTVWDQNMRGRSDGELAAEYQREGRAIITLDVGFADIRQYPPDQYAGLIVLRLKLQGRPQVMQAIEHLLPLFEQPPLAGRLWTVDEAHVRVWPSEG